MYPHERSLVKKHKDAAFAIIGVNSDPDRDAIRKAVVEEGITWRSFWNGPKGPKGPISDRWNIVGWPTVYLLDGTGTIRRKWLGGPTASALDGAIEALLEELR